MRYEDGKKSSLVGGLGRGFLRYSFRSCMRAFLLYFKYELKNAFDQKEKWSIS